MKAGNLLFAILTIKNVTDVFPISQDAFSRRNILKAFAVPVVGIPIASELYARSGRLQTLLEKGPSIDNDVKDITIIFHGAGGQDENTDNLLKMLRANASSKGQIIQMIDWSADSADILQASVKGTKIGNQMGQFIRDEIEQNNGNNVRNIQMIGISVGAFAADATLQTLNSVLDPITRKNINLQLTLLDPFQQKAVLGIGYGDKHFGDGADYAEQYLNTDDPVPSTNKPLQKCATVDVTSLRPPEIFGHDWPLVYYTQTLKGNGIVAHEERRTIGSVEIL